MVTRRWQMITVSGDDGERLFTYRSQDGDLVLTVYSPDVDIVVPSADELAAGQPQAAHTQEVADVRKAR